MEDQGMFEFDTKYRHNETGNAHPQGGVAPSRYRVASMAYLEKQRQNMARSQSQERRALAGGLSSIPGRLRDFLGAAAAAITAALRQGRAASQR